MTHSRRRVQGEPHSFFYKYPDTFLRDELTGKKIAHVAELHRYNLALLPVDTHGSISVVSNEPRLAVYCSGRSASKSPSSLCAQKARPFIDARHPVGATAAHPGTCTLASQEAWHALLALDEPPPRRYRYVTMNPHV